MSGQLRQWWLKSDPSILLQSEHRLLSALVDHPFQKPFRGSHAEQSNGGSNDGSAPAGGRINVVEFRAKGLLLHHREERPSHDDPRPTVILAHGFGSGSGFFYRNIDELLSSGKISRVVCVDWLGMGASDRPPCWQSPIRSFFSSPESMTTAPSTSTTTTATTSGLANFSLCNSKFNPARAVDFFLDPLDRLLRGSGSGSGSNLFRPGEPLWLVGHSLGGYLAARYAMRINQRRESTTTHRSASAESAFLPNLKKLILASPVGFQPLPSPNERISSSHLPPALRLVDALWSANFTPQSLVRAMGSSRGKRAVKRALHGRIPHLNQHSQSAAGTTNTTTASSKDSELDLLAEYLYHVTVAPASGEYAMNSLLAPALTGHNGAGVYAREPLGGGVMANHFVGNSISNEKVVASQQSSSMSSIESIKVLFGENDWMRFHEPAARMEMQSINNNHTCDISADVHIVPRAGHHLYLDNADSFVRHILED